MSREICVQEKSFDSLFQEGSRIILCMWPSLRNYMNKMLVISIKATSVLLFSALRQQNKNRQDGLLLM